MKQNWIIFPPNSHFSSIASRDICLKKPFSSTWHGFSIHVSQAVFRGMRLYTPLPAHAILFSTFLFKLRNCSSITCAICLSASFICRVVVSRRSPATPPSSALHMKVHPAHLCTIYFETVPNSFPNCRTMMRTSKGPFSELSHNMWHTQPETSATCCGSGEKKALLSPLTYSTCAVESSVL